MSAEVPEFDGFTPPIRPLPTIEGEVFGKGDPRPEPADQVHDDLPDTHRNAPQPDPVCLYGLIGDIARTASATTEASPYATALNALTYIGCCLGRGPYLPVGNTNHHARLFGMHVGRSGRGRKGDAVSLLNRVDLALRTANTYLSPQVHRGGLSSREGLAYLIHDGFKEGKNEVEPIHDKRLWVVESEFANVLHQSKRDGNTLSPALRDLWDGVGIKPATKSNRISASNPHVSISAAVTTTELLSLIEQRELSNGFANRFLMIFSERTKLEPFPQPTSQTDVDKLAQRVAEVLVFAEADRWTDRDHMRVSLSPEARTVYGRLYLGELNRYDYGPLVTGLLERRPPMLLRIGMIFALTDMTATIELKHLDAAMAWIRYWTDSVRFIFSSAAQEQVQHELADAAKKITSFLAENGRQSRTKISTECFKGKLSADSLNAALDELLHASPPTVIVEVEPRKGGPGSPTKYYVLAAESAKSAKCVDSRRLAADSESDEFSKLSEVSATSGTSLRSVRQPANSADGPANAHIPLNSLNSPQATRSCAACANLTKRRTCSDPIGAGLSDDFEIFFTDMLPDGGASCVAFKA